MRTPASARPCVKCGVNERRSPQQCYCRACHAAWMRAHRPTHSHLSPEERARANARSYANVYQRRGKLIPRPCLVCGKEPAQKHHEDYERPLQVEWICRRCYLKLRRAARRAVSP